MHSRRAHSTRKVVVMVDTNRRRAILHILLHNAWARTHARMHACTHARTHARTCLGGHLTSHPPCRVAGPCSYCARRARLGAERFSPGADAAQRFGLRVVSGTLQLCQRTPRHFRLQHARPSTGNTAQHVATRANALQHRIQRRPHLQHADRPPVPRHALRSEALRESHGLHAAQHDTAHRCPTRQKGLQRGATCWDAVQHVATRYSMLQHGRTVATRYSKLQHGTTSGEAKPSARGYSVRATRSVAYPMQPDTCRTACSLRRQRDTAPSREPR
jgi:hypothetical protein